MLQDASEREEMGEGKNEKNVSAWSMGNSSIVRNYSGIPKKQPPSIRPSSGVESPHRVITGRCSEKWLFPDQGWENLVTGGLEIDRGAGPGADG